VSAQRIPGTDSRFEPVADYQRGEAHVTLTNILIGLAAWTLISIPVGLFLGAILKHGAAPEPVTVPVRETTYRKSA
jgi:hypothetical protein